jgi:hypothetical protein
VRYPIHDITAIEARLTARSSKIIFDWMLRRLKKGMVGQRKRNNDNSRPNGEPKTHPSPGSGVAGRVLYAQPKGPGVQK